MTDLIHIVVSETDHKNLDARMDDAEKKTISDLWERLIVPVRAMVEKLSEEDAVFRDTLVSNLRDIVGLIPALNLN